jgi:hypothetical protein
LEQIFLTKLRREPGYLVKTTDLSQVTDKLLYPYICIEYTSSLARFELTTLVVIGTDCIGSCKSNYYAITTTTMRFVFNIFMKYTINQTYGINEDAIKDVRSRIMYDLFGKGMSTCILRLFRSIRTGI